VAKSILTLQKQLDSLASVTLQNLWGLDLLTAEKGGLCLVFTRRMLLVC
jgi:hypothetical protein